MRLTEKTAHGGYSVPLGREQEAIQRLAVFENIHQQLADQQGEISAQLEQLRLEGKKNSVKFRELMGKKLANSIVLSTFQANGL